MKTSKNMSESTAFLVLVAGVALWVVTLCAFDMEFEVSNGYKLHLKSWISWLMGEYK